MLNPKLENLTLRIFKVLQETIMAKMESHHRRSIRLKNYDYSQDGAYFVTICSHEKAKIFGEIIEETVKLTDYGKIIQEEWEQSAILRSNIDLDAFIIMPNHIHGIIVIHNELNSQGKVNNNNAPVGAQHDSKNTDLDVGAQRAAPLLQKPQGITPNNVVSDSLGAIIRAFKSAVTRRINILRNTPAAPVWQRNYWERIVRNEKELDATRLYIALNPAKWYEDDLYLANNN